MKGVYFFFERGEVRRGASTELRVVRVGRHGRNANSRSTIWTRMFEHKLDGGRSVFRDHINAALKQKAKSRERWQEHNHSVCISEYISKMPFLWVNVDGPDGHIMRGEIERNAIALLSDYKNRCVDKQSRFWLGKHSPKVEVRDSGLWNIQHTKHGYDCKFLNTFEKCVELTEPLETGAWNTPACLDV